MPLCSLQIRNSLRGKLVHVVLFLLVISTITFYANFNQFPIRQRHRLRQFAPWQDYMRSLVFRGEFCRPNTHVGFLKTHKTGSSTIFNILARFAISNDVPVATPAANYNHLCYPSNFSISTRCMLKPRGEYNMLMNHVRFSQSVRSVLPNDSYWFTILRDPLDYFESSYDYFNLEQNLGWSYETFMENHARYLPKFKIYSAKVIYRTHPLFGIAYDLGFDNFTKVSSEDVIRFMENQFDFVMIAEYFDESLVHLRKQLCWSYYDMVYVDQNKRKKDKNNQKGSKKESYRNLMKQIIPVYYEVYEYFVKKFREQILYNNDIVKDVQRFQSILKDKRDECFVDGKKPQDERLVPSFQPVPIYTYGLRSHSKECVRIALPELVLTHCLKNISYFDFETC